MNCIEIRSLFHDFETNYLICDYITKNKLSKDNNYFNQDFKLIIFICCIKSNQRDPFR